MIYKIGNNRIGDEHSSLASCKGDQFVANVPSALRFWKQLARLRLLDERQAELAFKKRDLLIERP